MTKAQEIFSKRAMWLPSLKTTAMAGTLGAAGLAGHNDKSNNIGYKATAMKGGAIGAIGGTLKGIFAGKGLKGIAANAIGGTMAGMAAGGLGRAMTGVKNNNA